MSVVFGDFMGRAVMAPLAAGDLKPLKAAVAALNAEIGAVHDREEPAKAWGVAVEAAEPARSTPLPLAAAAVAAENSAVFSEGMEKVWDRASTAAEPYRSIDSSKDPL